MHVDVEHSALARDDGRIEERGEPFDVGGCRHRQESQVRPDGRGDVEGEREAEIGGEVAFVDLVEDDETDAGQLGIGLQPTGEHALGHHLDPGGSTDVAFVARLVADEPADLGAGRVGHPASRGAGGQSARFEHHDALTVEPRLIEERQRDQRRLAGAGRCHEDGTASFGQCGSDRRDRLDDGKVGKLDGPRGHRLSPARASRGTDPGRRGRARESKSTSRPRRWRRQRFPTRAGSSPGPLQRRRRRLG